MSIKPNFQIMIAVSIIFAYSGSKKGLLVSIAQGQNIIGYRANGNGSVALVVLERLFEAEPLWRTLICRFIRGIPVWLS
jgi:hypothetical protein